MKNKNKIKIDVVWKNDDGSEIKCIPAEVEEYKEIELAFHKKLRKANLKLQSIIADYVISKRKGK